MKQVNQEIKAYLQVFVSHHQDDWADWLPLAKFAYNNHIHSATHHTPFELDSGQHPQMGSEPTQCRQENGSMHIPPMETSFSHQNISQSSQVTNPTVGRIFVGNPSIQVFKCFPNRDVIIS